jgi:hypothetical protein
LIELILLSPSAGTIGPPTDAKEMKMKRSLLSRFILLALGVLAVLAGCSAGSGSRFAAHDTTVEYYRVFDIRTDAAPQAVATAATDGIIRNVKDVVVATPPGVEATALPGHFRMADPTGAASAAPTCEGAAWTAKAAPHVRGSDNMNMVACLFPYRDGYHLDMYAIFTEPEGGWLSWPRQVGGMMMGTPEKFTENTMLDIVRAIRASTRAQVSLVEAKPNLPGTPWLEGGDVPLGTQASKP